jgi:hypothetical protein
MQAECCHTKHEAQQGYTVSHEQGIQLIVAVVKAGRMSQLDMTITLYLEPFLLNSLMIACRLLAATLPVMRLKSLSSSSRICRTTRFKVYGKSKWAMACININSPR